MVLLFSLTQVREVFMKNKFNTQNIQYPVAASKQKFEKELTATTEIERAIATITSLHTVQRYLFDLLEPTSKMQAHMIEALKCTVDEQNLAIQTLKYELNTQKHMAEGDTHQCFSQFELHFELVDDPAAEAIST